MTARCVYKYPLSIADYTELALPAGARVLHVAAQGSQFMLWALVEPTAALAESRRIIILGTGHSIDVVDGDQLRHISTFLVDGGQFVFHAFEVVPA